MSLKILFLETEKLPEGKSLKAEATACRQKLADMFPESVIDTVEIFRNEILTDTGKGEDENGPAEEGFNTTSFVRLESGIWFVMPTGKIEGIVEEALSLVDKRVDIHLVMPPK